MKRHWKKILILLAVFQFSLWVFGDPPVYFAKSIRGQVVDAETGQPLEGVVVVAKWQVYAIGIGSGGYGESMQYHRSRHRPGWKIFCARLGTSATPAIYLS